MLRAFKWALFEQVDKLLRKMDRALKVEAENEGMV